MWLRSKGFNRFSENYFIRKLGKIYVFYAVTVYAAKFRQTVLYR